MLASIQQSGLLDEEHDKPLLGYASDISDRLREFGICTCGERHLLAGGIQSLHYITGRTLLSLILISNRYLKSEFLKMHLF